MLTNDGEIGLHPFDENDSLQYLEWVNQEEFAGLLGRCLPVTSAEHESWYQSLVKSSTSVVFAVKTLIGAGVGAGVGALAGGAVTLLRKTFLMEEYNGTAPRETEGDMKLIVAGGVAGAAIGAGAGALSSLLNSTTHKYETEFVNTETKVIGQVPQGEVFYIPNDGSNQPPANTEQVADWMNGNIDKLARKGWVQTDHLRPENVEAQVPEKTILGNVKVRTEDKEVSVGPGMVGSIVGGAAVGAVTGVAGGILVNVLRKTL